MDVGDKDLDWEPAEPQTLIQGMKCAVCWDYFVKPHTLACGHTFCLRCLQNLARIARTSKSRTPLDRLRFRCPACRRRTLARPILRRKAAINYALKDLVNEWFDSPYSSGSVTYIKLRSVGSQTDRGDSEDRSQCDCVIRRRSVADDTREQAENINHHTADDSKTNISPLDINISKTEFREILFHKINSKSNLEKPEVNAVDSSPPSTDEYGGMSEETHVTTSSEESEESEQDFPIAPLFDGIRVLADNENNVLNRPRLRFFHVTSVSGVLAMLFAEIALIYRGIRNSRSRTMLTIFWFLYGGFIVCISRSFLPWMTFYTLIYFIIIYAEMASPSRPIVIQ